MSFLRRLFGGRSSSATRDDALYLYVRCGKCGTAVRARVDLGNDLAADYGDTSAEGYTLSKELMDDRCFRIMRATVIFDANRREVGREVEGGTFITAADYEASRAPERPTA